MRFFDTLCRSTGSTTLANGVMFVCQENSLLKKLKLHKGAVRAVEYDVEGKNILTGGKDKALKVGNDLVTVTLRFRFSLFPFQNL